MSSEYDYLNATMTQATEISAAAFTAARALAGEDVPQRSMTLAMLMLAAQQAQDDVGPTGAAATLRTLADTCEKGEPLLMRAPDVPAGQKN